MAWFNRLRNWVTDNNNGIGIRPDYHDSEDDNFATGINLCLNISGQNSPTANISWANYKITNLANGASSGDAINLSQLQTLQTLMQTLLQTGAYTYAATTNAADTYIATPSPVLAAYTTGQRFYINIGATNTGAATINLNSLGAKSIKKYGNTALDAGDLNVGFIYEMVYDGTNFQLLSPVSNMSKIYHTGSSIASASTIDLGAATGDRVDITGTTTITAIAAAPDGTLRDVRFTGILTLTYNATSLILPSNAQNITTAVGDTATFRNIGGSTNWICTDYQRANGTSVINGSVLQQVRFETGASSAGTTTIPSDNTIPQNTEGDQVMSLSITPTSSTSKLKIDVVAFTANNSDGKMTAALFQDSTANAIATGASANASAGGSICNPTFFTHSMTSGTTSATTFKVRVGAPTAGTTTFNGAAGAGLYGGTLASSITITELSA